MKSHFSEGEQRLVVKPFTANVCTTDESGVRVSEEAYNYFTTS